MGVKATARDLLGAHVSTQGGVARAPERGVAIGASAIQIFTKTPNQWREPVLDDDVVVAFRAALAASGIRAVVSHDSYLINLASPDEALRERSVAAFTAELARCRSLAIPWVASPPCNYSHDPAGRHEWIGEGTIGSELFRQIMRDPRLAPVIKIIETPKGNDAVYHDRRMLRRLRAYQRVARRNGRPTRTVGRA